MGMFTKNVTRNLKLTFFIHFLDIPNFNTPTPNFELSDAFYEETHFIIKISINTDDFLYKRSVDFLNFHTEKLLYKFHSVKE